MNKLTTLIASALVTGLVAGSVAQADHHKGHKGHTKKGQKPAAADAANPGDTTQDMAKGEKKDHNSCSECAGKKKE